MDIFELLTELDKLEISPSVQQYENVYKTTIESKFRKYFSIESGFYNTNNRIYRVLDSEEIINPKKFLGIDFISFNQIPIIDISDNDIICFKLQNNRFCIFNIIDEVYFMEKDNLNEIIENLEKEI